MLKYNQLSQNQYGTYNTETSGIHSGLTTQNQKQAKTITRTYKRKDGTTVTKTYIYDQKKKDRSQAGKVNDIKLLTKTGKLRKGMSLESIINKYGNGNPQKQEFIRNTLVKYMTEGKQISVGTLSQMWNHDKLSIFFANMGITIADIMIQIKMQAPDLPITESYIGNAEHWAKFDYDSQSAYSGTGTLILDQGYIAILSYNYWTRTCYVEVHGGPNNG